jgi:hypothetical protein
MIQDTITYNKLKDLIATSIFTQSEFTERLLSAVSPLRVPFLIFFFSPSPHPFFKFISFLYVVNKPKDLIASSSFASS